MDVFNSVLSDKDAIIKLCKRVKKKVTDTTEIDAEMRTILREMDVVVGMTKKCVEENRGTLRNQDEYLEEYNSYVERYDKLKSRHDELMELRELKEVKGRNIDRYIKAMENIDGVLDGFDERVWLTVVDTVTVKKDGTLVFNFYDGSKAQA